jgi:hypothetical protein
VDTLLYGVHVSLFIYFSRFTRDQYSSLSHIMEENGPYISHDQPEGPRFPWLSFLARLFFHLFRHITRILNNILLNYNNHNPNPTTDNQLLAELWHKPDNSEVVFVAISVYAAMQENQKIREVGISTWCLANDSKINSYHWRVNDESPSEGTSTLSDHAGFQYGTSEDICPLEVKPKLEQLFYSLKRHFSTICVILHDSERSIRLLESVWVLPSQTLLIDTQRVWTTQRGGSGRISLYSALREAPILSRYKHLVGNPGNDSRFILCLLQALGESASMYHEITGNTTNFELVSRE